MCFIYTILSARVLSTRDRGTGKACDKFYILCRVYHGTKPPPTRWRIGAGHVMYQQAPPCRPLDSAGSKALFLRSSYNNKSITLILGRPRDTLALRKRSLPTALQRGCHLTIQELVSTTRLGDRFRKLCLPRRVPLPIEGRR